MDYVEISDNHLDKFIELMKKEGKTFNDKKEAREAARNLVQFYGTLLEADQKHQRLVNKLKDHPNGFKLKSGARSCSLCKRHFDELWFDKWGFKCLECHEAFKKKIVPGYVFKDYRNEKHLTVDKLGWKYKVPRTTVRKLIKSGQIKTRKVSSSCEVILRKENPNLGDLLADEIEGDTPSAKG